MSSALPGPSLVDRLKSFPPERLARLRREAASRSFAGHALLAEALKRCGIKRVYGVSGTPMNRVFAECAARGIRPISPSSQQAAVLMAAAGNYVTGRLESAVVVSAGPAVANTATGILVARDNGWPVLVLGGRRALHHEGIGYFQELDAVPMLSPITRMAATVRKTTEIVDRVLGAFATAQTGRRGPVYLDLPEDVLEGYSTVNPALSPELSPPPEIESKAIRESARLLAEAKRPLLILGEDIRWSFHLESLRKLVEDFGIPFITSPMGRGYLPDDHPLCANEVRRSIQRQADLAVMAGAWFDWRFRFGTELFSGARVIHADTDTETLGKNVPANVTVLGEPGEFLARLADALGAAANGDGERRYSAWRELLVQAREESRKSCEAWLRQQSRPLLPQQLYLALRDVLPADTIVAVEGNISLAAAQQVLRARQPASWLDPGRNGVIGASIPFAMGAKLAYPERTVVALCGDTGFSMSAMNLEAAVRHRIPIVVVIANNDGNTGSVQQKMFFPADYPERFAEFLPKLRYERIVEMFGGHAECITEVAAIRPALERALASDLPACLNVHLDPNAPHPGYW